jgi:hypothetical protein
VSVTVPDVVRELHALSPERVAEVYDFVLFLKSRPTLTVDVDDAWSEEDRRDASLASLQYADTAIPDEEDQDD